MTEAPWAWKETFRVILSAQVSATLAIGADNKLSVTIAENPAFTIVDTIVAGNSTIGSEIINDAIRSAIPKIMANISKSINGIEIPSIAGFSITTDSITAIGTNKRHLGISGSLNTLPSANAGDDSSNGDESGNDDENGDVSGEGESSVICFP